MFKKKKYEKHENPDETSKRLMELCLFLIIFGVLVTGAIITYIATQPCHDGFRWGVFINYVPASFIWNLMFCPFKHPELKECSVSEILYD